MVSPRVLTTLVAMLMLVPALAWPQERPLATYGSARIISSAGQDASQARVGIDAAGNAVFAWTRFDGSNFRIQTRARSAAGVLSSVQSVSPDGEDAFQPVIAVNASGAAVVAWVRFDTPLWQVKMRVRSATGVLSPVHVISNTARAAFGPVVAIEPNGRALVTWQAPDASVSRIRVRALSAGGVLGATQTVSDPGQDASQPHLAIDPDGRALVTWQRFDGTSDRVQARTRSAAGVLGPVETVSPAGVSAEGSRVAIAPDGSAIITWERVGTNTRIQTVARSATGVLSAVQRLSPDGPSARRPRVAVDSAGNAVFVWHSSDGTNVRVHSRARSADGVLSAVQNLSPAGEDSANAEVGVDASGNAMFVWEVFDEMDIVPGGLVRARARSSAGTLGVVRTLGTSEVAELVPDVAVNPDGDVVFAWSAVNGANRRAYLGTATLP
jgi:hypothetical protein